MITPTIERLNLIRTQLGESIVGYQDKNSGACTISCPCVQHARERRMYHSNPASFTVTDMNTLGLYILFEAVHTKHDWRRLAPFPSWSRFKPPYGYVFEKAKDPNKDRPIVSYFSHPFKTIYNIGSRALSFCAKHSDIRSFTLWAIKDMSPTITTWSSNIAQLHGPHTRFLSWMADVKEMFTRLPHDELEKSIDFTLHMARATKRGRRGALCVERIPRGAVRFGRASTLEPQFVTISFADLRTILVTDIRTCFFTSLSAVIHQHVGVPMGSQGAPNIAINYCAWREHLFLTTITNLTSFGRICLHFNSIRLCRYVDDVLGVIAYDIRDPTALPTARLIFHHIIHYVYHHNLRLETEPTQGWFPFLQALLHIPPDGPIDVKYHVKNFEPIATTFTAKFLSIQHRRTFMSAHDAVIKIVGALHRLRQTVTHRSHAFIGILQLFHCFRYHGYTHNTFNSALRHMHRTTHESIWQEATPLISAL